MLKMLIIIIISCIPIIFTSGCWDYKDLDELNIPIVGIYDTIPSSDKKETNINVAAIAPVLYPETEKKYMIEFISASTIGKTREKRSSKSPEQYFEGIVQIAIYGENLAHQGLNKATNALFRSPTTSNAIYLAVLEGHSQDFTKLKMVDYPNPGVFLMGLLKTAQKNSFLPTTTLHQFMTQVVTTGKNPVLPLIKIKDKSQIEISGAGIFKNDRLLAKTNLEDTQTLVLLRGLKGEGRIPFILEKDGEILDEGTVIVNRSRKVQVYRKDDEFTFFIKIKLQGGLLEHFSPQFIIDGKNPIKLTDIEKAIKMDIEQDCTDFIKKMQEEYKTDCIDITKYALAKWRRELTDHVQEDFIENVNILVDVEVNLKDIGELT